MAGEYHGNYRRLSALKTLGRRGRILRWQRCHLTTHAARSISLASPSVDGARRGAQDDPLNLKGSFAGAMGYGLFMPSSYKQYAVDFSGDGHINLWIRVDAIGKAANYFKAHGWVKGDQVAVMANGQAPGLPNGFKTKYSISQLAAAGLTPQQAGQPSPKPAASGCWHRLPVRHWYGLPNFYNYHPLQPVTHYAMAVWQIR